LGHAKSYISFDVILRYLRFKGYKVTYVQNITDVGHLTDDADEGEDKIVRKARAERMHPMQIAETYTFHYFQDMDALNVLRPDISPRATGHIPEQIDLIEKLMTKGTAYEVNGSVYFDTRNYPGYGKLSGRNLDEILSGTRVESHSDKRFPADFALWKKAEPSHIMRWNSPWGVGFPGWHIECSAMSMKYLGESFDIHGGGMDNQFPHHECEIAQSEGVTARPFVTYWLHNNLVTVKGQKMSKSLGNFITLKDAFEKFDPISIRFFILQSHYRSTLDFSDDALGAADVGLEKLKNTVRNLRSELGRRGIALDTPPSPIVGSELEAFQARFIEAMDDDFNVPQAIAVLFDLVRECNIALSSDQTTSEQLLRFNSIISLLGGTVLGIDEPPGRQSITIGENITPKLIDLAIDVRTEARKQKLFPLSDLIRDRLKQLNVILEDKREGTVWKIQR
jgi:cysteinyl-tRNA synthetase